MGNLIYSVTTSLDGYVADEKGNFDWTEPSEETLLFVDNVLRNVRTFLFGRKLYETMSVWDAMTNDRSNKGVEQFANIWKIANKIVYSTSLTQVNTVNTIIKSKFDVEKIKAMVAKSDYDFNIGGPNLAATAIKAGIVDEIHQYIAPIIVGGGNFWLPKNYEAKLEAIDVRRFKNGCVHLQYKSVDKAITDLRLTLTS